MNQAEQPLSDLLILTVDVECDADGGRSWRNSNPLTFHGVSDGLGKVLLPILEKNGATASLLLSNVVLSDASSVELLAGLPRVELGTHLHGDFLSPGPPVNPAGADPADNQNEYPDEIERVKLEHLTDMYVHCFGRRPTAFRAGRWSAGGRTARLLVDLGYLADSSVSPHVHWRDAGRSVDYRHAPDQPYRPSALDIATRGELALWEFPVSIVKPPYWPRPIWLRPSVSGLATMKYVIRTLRKTTAPPRTFVLMFHNNELTTGTSPYSRTPAVARRVQRRLDELLAWARSQGMGFATLSEAALRQSRFRSRFGFNSS